MAQATSMQHRVLLFGRNLFGEYTDIYSPVNILITELITYNMALSIH